jgi:hypothetical protein
MELVGLMPDGWQTEVLSSTSSRTLLLCSRQSGKSTTAAAVALKTAFLCAGSLTLVLSPSLRQSGESFRKVMDLGRGLGWPVPPIQESALTVTLANRSRVVSLPGSEPTVRGFSGVSLLVIDEASRVSDDLYRSVRPMLAVSGGRLLALSTPYAKLGWFHAAWVGEEPWQRVRVPATECRRISPEFLREERRALGPRWYEMEYECEFQDAIDAVFAHADVAAAMADDEPLFVG